METVKTDEEATTMTGKVRTTFALLTALGYLAAISVASDVLHPASASPPATGSSAILDNATTTAAAAASPSVVKVESSVGLGSGVIMDARGYIVTNYHVLFGGATNRSARAYKVTLSTGATRMATIAGIDAPDDLAVLKITALGLRPIQVANSDDLRVGQFTLAVGAPLGFVESVTMGIVSTLHRNVIENGPATVIPNMIQTSAPINPGNSGGALVDLDGHLAGIPTLAAMDPTFGTTAQGIGFAIPSNRVVVIVNQIITNGKVVHSGRPYLGLSDVQEVTTAVAAEEGLPVQSGMLIGGVVPGGPAHQAGLRPGDVIVRIDEYSIANQEDFANALARLHPGQLVLVTVVDPRGVRRTVDVTLGELPVPSM
jgi:S1-C subfamily serine protease